MNYRRIFILCVCLMHVVELMGSESEGILKPNAKKIQEPLKRKTTRTGCFTRRKIGDPLQGITSKEVAFLVVMAVGLFSGCRFGKCSCGLF